VWVELGKHLSAVRLQHDVLLHAFSVTQSGQLSHTFEYGNMNDGNERNEANTVNGQRSVVVSRVISSAFGRERR
jgi:hypothetical protein